LDLKTRQGRRRVKVRSPRSKSPFRCSATKNHVSIDRAYGFVRRFAVSNAAAHNGARLPDVLDKTNTASQVWAKRAKGSVKRSLMEWRTEGGTAYRSKANEAHMNERFRVESPFPPARRRLSDCMSRAWSG
jgi:hypothetical protein